MQQLSTVHPSEIRSSARAVDPVKQLRQALDRLADRGARRPIAERLALRVGAALVRWGARQERPVVDRDLAMRRDALERDRREREHGELRRRLLER